MTVDVEPETKPSGTARIGNWLPSPEFRVQHRLTLITYEQPQLHTACGAVVVTYPPDDPRVPWTSWQHCRDCAAAPIGGG